MDGRPPIHTNTVEGYLRGTYQHCKENHLHRYLAEFDFRYNNRVKLGVNDEQRAAKMVKGARWQAAHLSNDWPKSDGAAGLTPEQAATAIHLILSGMAPIERMIMLRSVQLAFDPDGVRSDAFEAGLEHGQSAGLFAVRGLALLRKV